MKTISRDIAGAILFSNNEHVLIGKNNKGGVYEDLWVIPGGGIDEGETKEQAAKREILEEVGIDLSNERLTAIPVVQTGTTEKTLRDTGERVLVEMTFYNFKVEIDTPASEINFSLDDDFGYAEWVPFDQLATKKYSPSVQHILSSLELI